MHTRTSQAGRGGSCSPTQPQQRRVPAAHGAPGGRTDVAPAAGHASPSGTMHRWFPVAVPNPPISVSKKGHLAAGISVGAGGFEPPAAMAVISNRHVARLLFRRLSKPSAESGVG